MHTSYTTEKITQQRMAENAQRARIHADRNAPRARRRRFAFPSVVWWRRVVPASAVQSTPESVVG